MSKVLFGSISYRTGIKSIDDKRMVAHTQQLRWLEMLKLGDYHYYRVEQNYDEDWRRALSTSMPFTPLSFSSGIGPSRARNVLLDILYQSDSDWLVCMDDDRILYDHYAGYEFLGELGVNPGLLSLARQGALISGIVPQIRSFKEENAKFEKVDEFWNLKKGILDGCLQIVCIPNLVKFGKKPIYFDETNQLTKDMPPEDIQFLIDWMLSKNPTFMNNMMVVYDLMSIPKGASTIYIGQDRDRIQTLQNQAVIRYIREKTHNRITTKKLFTIRKNLAVPVAVPRLKKYRPIRSDFDKFAELTSINFEDGF